MTDAAKTVVKTATLVADEQEYALVQLPARAITAAAGVVAEVGEAFCALIVDQHEVTLIIPMEAWVDFQARLPSAALAPNPYRLITFDLVLNLSLVGFMALVSRALADAGVSILPLAAYSRDHILVPADQLAIAMDALRRLQSAPSS